MIVQLKRSPRPSKKFRVILKDGDVVDFGARGYSDYTIHKTPQRMRSYVRRHGGYLTREIERLDNSRQIHRAMLRVKASSKEDWSKSGIRTAGFWSRWLLWSEPTLERAKRRVSKIFGIEFRLSDADIKRTVSRLRAKYGKAYAPTKYFRGLASVRDVEARYKRILASDDTPFKTDIGVRTRKSSHTRRFKKLYPGVRAGDLRSISSATGVPEKTLRIVYARGLAAWKTGHRPGASAHAWALARVHSYVTKGKTFRTANADLSRKNIVHR